MRAASVNGVRVTWNITTIPPECVASVRVKFKLSEEGNVSSVYNTTNISETEIIHTGLKCATKYYIRVVVDSNDQKGTWKSPQVELLVGGKLPVGLKLALLQKLFSGIAIAQIYQPHLE